MIPDLQPTFRWFGPYDAVTLSAIKQTGAKGIVTALHQVPCGDVWGVEEVRKRREMVNKEGFSWAVVESVNIHESIKIGSRDRDRYIDNYIHTLTNLANEGMLTVCYNFMPVLDWTRTHLDYRLANNASALLYNATALAAFDLYILERDGALNDFSTEQQKVAKLYLDSLDDNDKLLLTNTILAGLPGTDEVFTINEFKAHLHKYSEIDAAALKENLFYFLRAIIPHAEKLGIKMCIHPDDPPSPILGLPRVASTLADLTDIVNCYPSIANGITLCTGSLGASVKNDIPNIIKELGSKIHFLHLRNVQRLPDGSFYEADHLSGSVDMYEVMKAIITEQITRKNAGRSDIAIPMRPDHGHKILDDFKCDTYPGYSAIGRLKGLAELRGLEMGVKRSS